ncbi:ATP-binding protein [Amycolatopsis australiensis]|uniref:DNA helicase HerA, contains HAS-barrel and ATPase domains n=1 Tax=Amycolatopsis australiensis TaxID=546364 RepID=A0A1K1PRD8_9PSEU|nr:helicase HerA-like domain-containing protein [Amycolatopsis australiensis]SFW50113.1 DNA helicase HerA, contains HAS-barrel and ATPase domains [Amycolatopsis australiensis]
MSPLDGFGFHRLLSVPRGDDLATNADRPDETGGRAPAQLFAALTAAHAGLRHHGPDAAFAVAWDRTGGARPLRVLVGGRPHSPVARPAAGPVPILYPPGSLGTPVPAAEVADRWAALPAWTRCAGGHDPLWTPQSRSEAPGRGGFDDYVAHLPGEFVWLVVAEPLGADAVERELVGLETTIPRLRQRENSEPDRIALLRAEGRYRELSRAQSAGLWTVHVLVGGPDEPSARAAAALLCSASDLDTLPYVLTPGTECAKFAEAWQAPGAFSAPGEFVAAIARPPRRELPGIRMTEPPLFDVTPEQQGEVPLGTVLDDADQPVGEFSVALDTLNRHTFVAGATGSGKSQTVRHLLAGLHEAGVPWLVIEPAKAEYAAMAGRIGPGGRVTVIRPGDPDAYPAGLNPLEPVAGFPLQTHLDLTRALFMAAFDADEPFPQVLAQALTRCYTEQGWDPVTGEVRGRVEPVKYPSLGDLQATAIEVVKGIGYGKEVADNVRGFVDVRIGSLRLGTPGRFFEGGHPLDVAALLRGNVVLEIEDIGSDMDKAFFIGAVLIRLFEHLRVHHGAGSPGLRHVLVLEEAHRLLKRAEPGSPTEHAVELFTSLLAEIRAYGEGIVVAEQIPGKIVPDVIKNTACKILHRLPAEDDRLAVGATMNLSEAQSRHVVTLPPGRAAVFTDGMDRPLRLSMPLGESLEDASAVSKTPALAARRSVACGQLCAERPCTLRELGRAVYRADEDPQLVLWLELLTVAHITGRRAPEPDPGWIASLHTAYDERTLECAVAHRIQAAVDARYAGITEYNAADEFVAHLASSAGRTLAGAPSGCDGTEVRWQAGSYRWYDVLVALKRGEPVDTSSRGLELPGSTPEERLASLRRRPDTWRNDDATVLGTVSPTRINKAASRLSNARDAVTRFESATAFLNLKFPAARVLRMDTKRGAEG